MPSIAKHLLAFKKAPIWFGMEVAYVFFMFQSPVVTPLFVISSYLSLFCAFHNSLGNIAQHMDIILIVCFDRNFHDSVSIIALRKISDYSLTTQNIPGIYRLVPFDLGGFSGKQFFSEKVHFQILCPN